MSWSNSYFLVDNLKDHAKITMKFKRDLAKMKNKNLILNGKNPQDPKVLGFYLSSQGHSVEDFYFRKDV